MTEHRDATDDAEPDIGRCTCGYGVTSRNKPFDGRAAIDYHIRYMAWAEDMLAQERDPVMAKLSPEFLRFVVEGQKQQGKGAVKAPDVYLTEPAQLDELPERSAVRSRYGLLGEKGPDGKWYTPPMREPIEIKTLLTGGVRVLDLGTWLTS